MQIPLTDLAHYFKLALNVLRNSLNCVEEATKGSAKISDEEIKLITLDITRLKMIILLYVFIFKRKISLENIVTTIFLGNSDRAEKMLTIGYKDMQLTKVEKERILEKAFDLGEADFESVVFFKKARKVLAEQIGDKYISLLPLYDEVTVLVNMNKAIRNCTQVQLPTLSNT